MWITVYEDVLKNAVGAVQSAGSTPRAGDILVHPEELKQKAEICFQVGTSLQGTLNEVHAIMNEFFNSDVFEGQQAEQVRSNYANATENLNRFPQMVSWFGNKLNEAAYVFTEADKDNITLYAEQMFAATILPGLPADMQAGFFTKMGNDPEFAQQVISYLESGGKFIGDNPEDAVKAAKAVKALKSLYDISKGTNVVITASGDLALASGAAAGKLAKGMAAAGALISIGMGFYEAFTGGDQSAEMIAAQLSSGLVQAALGFTPVGAIALAADALIQFVGPYVADVMRDNADWLAGGGMDSEDIVAVADMFDQSIKDISIDDRLDGAFNALYHGDIIGVFEEFATFQKGIYTFMGSGIALGGMAVYGLAYKGYEYVSDGIMQGVNWASDAFDTAGTFVTDTLNNIMGGVSNWVGDITSSISSGINTAVDTVVNTAIDAWNATQNWFSDVGSTIGGGFVDAGNAVVDFFESAGDGC